MKKRYGWGDYYRIGPDHGMQDALSWNVYQPVTPIHGLGALLDPLLETVQSTGLVAVKAEAIGPSVVALDSMTFTPQTKDDPITGVATFLPTSASLSGSWVESYVAAGYGVLINLASVSSAQPALTMTKHADIVATSCTPSGGWAWLTGPPDLMVAAHNILLQRQGQGQPATPTAAEACVAQGGMWDGEASRCVFHEAAITPTPTTKSSWVVPAIAIGGTVLLLGILMIAQKE
jgi:hypothetical protein